MNGASGRSLLILPAIHPDADEIVFADAGRPVTEPDVRQLSGGNGATDGAHAHAAISVAGSLLVGQQPLQQGRDSRS